VCKNVVGGLHRTGYRVRPTYKGDNVDEVDKGDEVDKMRRKNNTAYHAA
jgi:hypothetical protein